MKIARTGTLSLDHIAVSGETLAEAQAHVEEALGVALQPGGAHDVFSTHNALLGLADGLYLEAIATNPDAARPAQPRWFDLDRFVGRPRLTNWICRTDDLDAALAAQHDDFGSPVDLRRGDLRWRMAVPDDGRLPFDNCAPALMQWQSSPHPATRLKPSGLRLVALTVRHPQVEALQRNLQPGFSDPRVRFETGSAGLHARFDTPHGPRDLGA